jgi:hypothetical protein
VPVEDDELVARFVLTRKHLPKSGGGVKAEALLPFSRVELSVTRHRNLSESELLEIGNEVAEGRRQKGGRAFPLVGRVDFLALVPREQGLDVIPAEGFDLPKNHADVVGWPAEKSAQMSLAQEIAAKSALLTL